jgi:hypothetical protein
MPVLSHLFLPLERTFWCDTLCFDDFDRFAAIGEDEDEARAALREVARDGGAERAVEAVVAEAGGSLAVRANLTVALAFLRERRTQAIEDAAAAWLTAEQIAEHRGRNLKVRRFPLAIRLFEESRDSLLAISLWDQWHARRGTWYQLQNPLPEPIAVQSEDWATVAAAALTTERARKGTQCGTFEAPVAFLGAEGDVLIGYREWPLRQAVKVKDEVVTGQRPIWTLARVYSGGDRFDITDTVQDRGAGLAGAMIRQLRPQAGELRQVLNELTDAALDDFLRRITEEGTAEGDAFPLVELTAALPWDARHRTITLHGKPGATAESVVGTLRQIGPFAKDWRTVKSAKLLFEGAYRIEVHFPIAGKHRALAYSDIDRDKRVTRRFAERLNRVLGCEVAPKARADSRLPRPQADKPLRPQTAAWWQRLLVPAHDQPPDWVLNALADLVNLCLIRTEDVGVLNCGSPYLERAKAGADWAECKGEVELPLTSADEDDELAVEDDQGVWCSERDHRWRPKRYRLPVDHRVKVALLHDRAWGLVREEAAHYGVVEEEPGRPGVASVRLADSRAYVGYTELAGAEEREPGAFGRAPVAWVAPPFGATAPGYAGALPLARVLAGDDVLAPAWGLAAPRRREAIAGVVAAPEGERIGGTVIEVRGPRDIRVGGRPVAKHRPAVAKVARLLLSAQLAGERRPRTTPELVALAKNTDVLSASDNDAHLHVLVRRAREGVDDAAGVVGRGAEAFVTDVGYRLGDGWEVRHLADRSADQL